MRKTSAQHYWRAAAELNAETCEAQQRHIHKLARANKQLQAHTQRLAAAMMRLAQAAQECNLTDEMANAVAEGVTAMQVYGAYRAKHAGRPA